MIGGGWSHSSPLHPWPRPPTPTQTLTHTSCRITLITSLVISKFRLPLLTIDHLIHMTGSHVVVMSYLKHQPCALMAAPQRWHCASASTPKSIDFHPEVRWDPRVGFDLCVKYLICSCAVAPVEITQFCFKLANTRKDHTHRGEHVVLKNSHNPSRYIDG